MRSVADTVESIRSHDLLELVLSRAPVVLWATDAEGIFTMLRGSGLSVLGMSDNQIVGRSLYELYADYPDLIADVKRTLAGDEFRKRVRVNNIYFDNWFAPLRGGSGTVTGVLGVATIVTERVLAETALKESEERFTKAFHASPVGIVISDAKDGTFVDVNDAFLRMMGLNREEVLGRSVFELNRWVDPSDRTQLIEELQVQGSVRDREYEFFGSDQTVRTGRLSAELMKLNGRSCLLVIAEDITEHKNAATALQQLAQELESRVDERTRELEVNNARLEREIAERKRAVAALQESQDKWQSLVEHAPDFVLTMSRDGTIEFINRTQPNVTREELLGTSIFDYMEEPQRTEFKQLFDEVLRTGQPQSYESQASTPFGDESWYSSRIAPIMCRGKVESLIMLATDITRRKEAEDSLRRRQQELEHVSRLIATGEMASEVAHEVNNPICVISNYATGLIKHGENGELTDDMVLSAMKNIMKQSEIALTTIQRVRRFVQKRDIQISRVDPRSLIDEAVALVKPKTRDRSVRIHTSFGEPLPLVEVDNIQMMQVLVNILLNGIEAMRNTPSDERVLRVEAHGHNQKLHIAVTDNGEGLPPNFEDRIFEAFFTTKTDGLGMGLSICRSIVEAHAGQLRPERNATGRGSTFHILLPTRAEGRVDD